MKGWNRSAGYLEEIEWAERRRMAVSAMRVSDD